MFFLLEVYEEASSFGLTADFLTIQQVQVLHDRPDQRVVISAIELFSPLSSLIMGWTTGISLH